MDLKQIKGIISLMKSSNLIEFEIEEKDLKLRIKRGAENEPVVVINPTAVPGIVSAPVAVQETTDVPVEEEGVTMETSPMVGTFYRASSPDKPSFVEKGAEITKGTVLCIIEAMKVMNEIKAENSGTVVEILLENEESVEYGQALFKIKT